MQNIYEGQYSGLMTGEALRQQRAERLARQREEAMRQQTAVHLAQLAMQEEQRRREQQAKASQPPAAQEQRQWGERVPATPSLSMASQQGEKDSFDAYIKGVALGNPQEAERLFPMVQPGSTKVEEDGSVSFTSREGHPVNVPGKHVQKVLGYGGMTPYQEENIRIRDEGLKMRSELGGKTPEEIENIKADTELKRKRAAGELTPEEKSLKQAREEDIQSKIEARKFAQMENVRSKLGLARDKMATKKDILDKLTGKGTSVPFIGKVGGATDKEIEAARKAYAEAESDAERLSKMLDMDETKKAGASLEDESPKQTPVQPATAPAVQAPAPEPKRGSGFIRTKSGRGIGIESGSIMDFKGGQTEVAPVYGKKGETMLVPKATANGAPHEGLMRQLGIDQGRIDMVDATRPGAPSPSLESGSPNPNAISDQPVVPGTRVGQRKQNPKTGVIVTWDGTKWM